MTCAKLSLLFAAALLLTNCGQNTGHRVAIRRNGVGQLSNLSKTGRLKVQAGSKTLSLVDLIKTFTSDKSHTYFVYTQDLDFLQASKDGTLQEVSDPNVRAVVALKDNTPVIEALSGNELLGSTIVGDDLKVTAQDATSVTMNGASYKVTDKARTYVRIASADGSKQIIYSYSPSDDSLSITTYQNVNSSCASIPTGTLKKTYTIAAFRGNSVQAFSLQTGLADLINANIATPPEFSLSLQAKGNWKSFIKVPTAFYYAIIGELQNADLTKLVCK